MEEEEPEKIEEIPSEEQSEVDKVSENYNKLKEMNDKTEAELLRGEQLRAKAALGGKAEAGSKPVVETEDEKWAREAKVRYEGTGMDPTDNEA